MVTGMPTESAVPAGFRLSAAEDFVLANGNPRQRAYWKAAFGWGPVETWLFEMEGHQGPLGGWGNGLVPADGGRADSVPGTAAVLRWLAWLNLGEDIFEVVPRTMAYLASCQAPDGSWEERGVAETAAIGAYLAFLGVEPELVEAAARFVVGESATASLAPGYQALAFALVRGRALPGGAEFAERTYDHLLDLLGGTPLSTGELAWVHEATIQAGLGPDDRLRAAVRDRLVVRQSADGSFPADDPAWDRVDTTLLASRALVTR